MNSNVHFQLKHYTTWYKYGTGLPNAPCKNFQLNKFAQKLRVGTFGIGAWEYKMQDPQNPGAIYVRDNLTIGGSTNIDYDVVVCSGGKLTVPQACTISMAAGKKITINGWWGNRYFKRLSSNIYLRIEFMGWY